MVQHALRSRQVLRVSSESRGFSEYGVLVHPFLLSQQEAARTPGKGARPDVVMTRLSVGDSPASSLSSCLCAFPGGVSLLTETGLLRPFLVSDAAASEEGSAASATAATAAGAIEVIAAAPVHLSDSSPEGSFPADGGIPVDHAWSQDGNVVVVLRRASFTAYARPATAVADLRRRIQALLLSPPPRPSTNDRAESSRSSKEDFTPTPSSRAAPSLGLIQMHTGSNGFEGKVVACCLLDSKALSAQGATYGAASSGRSCKHSNIGSIGVKSYLIAVGGTFGVECHALEIRQRSKEGDGVGRKHDPQPDSSRQRTETPTATCRPVAKIFQGYPVVALAFSPDSALIAAAAMTGHVKVWETTKLVGQPPTPSPPQRSVNARSRKESGSRGGRGVKHKGLEEALSALRSPPAAERCSDLAALWGKALPMARATSLSFSPDDSATFALACWDGGIALFLPTTAAAAAAAAPPSSLSSTWAKTAAVRRENGAIKDLDSRRAWKHVWRPAAPPPAKIGGGKGGANLEDQDGAFLCWCKDPQGLGATPADLAVSSYHVATGDCPKRRCAEENQQRDDRTGTAPTSPTGGALPPATLPGESLLREPITGGLPLKAATGPGFDVFEGGLGERVGGVVSGPRPPGLTPEPTAERYLVHGLAAGPSFVALYDSDQCLHVVSLAAIISAGCVLPPPTQPLSTSFTDASGDLLTPDGAAVPSPEATEASTPSSASTTEITLVNNDHGLVKAWVLRHSGPDGVQSAADSGEGLKLAITWRNALTGVETPDDGKCAGEESGGNNRRLSFLPGELADRDWKGDCWDGGAFGADVRWGSLALFTRYTVLVYTHLDRKEAAGDGRGARGGSAPVAGPAGGWRAFAEHPIVDGLLLGGACTSSTFLPNLPKPSADLNGLYLLMLLGATNEKPGSGPVVLIQSLRDESVACRRPLELPDNRNGKEGGVAGKKQKGGRVYVSPGYAGGAFVATMQGGDRECARVWRGSFDEDARRLDIGPSRVITSHPWPEPETLRLQGVAGPNCELFLFKEIGGGSDAAEGANADTNQSVRWWMTWPEAEIWNCVDAPAMLGEEVLGIADFVNIFQLEIEGMLISYDQPGGDDGNPPPSSDENVGSVRVAPEET